MPCCNLGLVVHSYGMFGFSVDSIEQAVELTKDFGNIATMNVFDDKNDWGVFAARCIVGFHKDF